MRQFLYELVEFLSFMLLMFVIGFGTILYIIFVFLYWLYAVLTNKEHLVK